MMRQLIAALSLGFLAYGAMAGSWEVMDANNTVCLLLDMNLTFAVQYTASDKSLKTATFDLPSNATVATSSACGKHIAYITLDFLTGDSIMFNFKANEKSYLLESLTFVYVQDSENFPDAKEPGKEVRTEADIVLFSTPVGYSYRCNSEITDKSITGVDLTFSDVKLQPFGVTNGTFSKENVCDADLATTAVPMTTSYITTVPMTTASNTTANTTIRTEVMTTIDNNSTTIETTTPLPATTLPPKPTEGNWTVKDANNKTCMNMAFNATFNVTYTDKKNKTAFFTGLLPLDADPSMSMCNENASAFILQFNDSWTMEMVFEKTADKKYFEMNLFTLQYYVDAIQQSEFVSINDTYFRTNVNKTYMCNADQRVKAGDVTVTFSDVKLQPFANGANYPGDLEDCKSDDNSSNIVPIAVGCALAGLVVIVLIAYLIGRKRTKNVGYQTV